MKDGTLTGARQFLLLSALIYPFASIAIFVLAFRADPFAIFDPGYLLGCFVALPVVWCFFTILWARQHEPLPKHWVAVHVVILGLVTFLHFWVMVQFSAGV